MSKCQIKERANWLFLSFCLLIFLLNEDMSVKLWHFSDLCLWYTTQSSLSFDLLMPVTLQQTPPETETSRGWDGITEAWRWFGNWLHASRLHDNKLLSHGGRIKTSLLANICDFYAQHILFLFNNVIMITFIPHDIHQFCHGAFI